MPKREISHWSYNNVLEKQASDHLTGQRSTVKQVPYRPDSSLKQELMTHYKDDGIPCEIDTFFVYFQNIYVGSPFKINRRTRKKKTIYAPVRAFADELRTLVPEGEDKRPFVVPAIDARLLGSRQTFNPGVF